MNAPGERVLRVGDGLFDPLSGELSLDGRRTRLRPRTAAFLSYLVQHADRVVGKDELMAAIWPDAVVTEDSLVQCVKEIRHALGRRGRDWIRTHPRVGYSFVADAPVAQSPAGQAGTEVVAPRRVPRHRLAAALGAIVVATAAVLGWNQWQRDTHAPLSLVVLPVVNATGDPARDDAADEITEAITDTVARMQRTSVIAATTAFTFKDAPVDVRQLGGELKVRYVLQASLRDKGGQPMVLLRLTDAPSAVQLWTGEFPLQPNGLPELRDDALEGVASALGVQLLRAAARSSARPAAAEAAEKLSRARALVRWSGEKAQPIVQASELLEDVVRAEPGSALAWSLLATTHLAYVRFSTQRELHFARAEEAVRRAIELAPDSDGVRVIEGNLLYERRRMPEALRAYERALEANPSNADALARRGAALVMLGRPEEAIAPITQAMRLSPRDLRLAHWSTYLGVAHLHLGQEAEAVAWLARAVDAAPENAFGRLFLASALGAAGRLQEARLQMAELQRLHPGYTLARFKAVEPSNAPAFLQQRQRVYEGLRRAGMPE